MDEVTFSPRTIPTIWVYPDAPPQSVVYTDPSDSLLAVLVTVILIAAILVTNGSVLAAYCLNRAIRELISPWILNLVLLDILAGSMALPVSIFMRRMSLMAPKHIGTVPCLLAVGAPRVVLQLGILSVVLVTLEKLITIMRPLTYTSVLTGRLYGSILVTIVLVIVLWVFYPALNPATYTPETVLATSCHGKYVFSMSCVLVYTICGLVAPLLLTMAMYITMYLIARRHRQSIDNQVIPADVIAEQPAIGLFRIQMTRLSKGAKTVFILSSLYELCRLPFLVLVPAGSFCMLQGCPRDDLQEFRRWMQIAIIMAMLHSAVNPVLYVSRTSSVRKLMWKMLPGSRQVVDENSPAPAAAAAASADHG